VGDSDPPGGGAGGPADAALPPGTAVVALHGDLDLAHAAGVGEALASVPAEADLVVDLTEVGFCDSVGLSQLVAAARRHRIAGARIAVHGPSPAVQRLLQVTRLDTLLPTDPTDRSDDQRRSGTDDDGGPR
jgi:anti-sigma B factor antagonist